MQILGQGKRARESPRRLLLQALQADGLQLGRQIGAKLPGRQRFLGQNLVNGQFTRLGLKRRPAREHFIKNGAQRIDICRRPDGVFVTCRLFRRHVAGGAHYRVGPGQSLILVQPFGQPEVGDLRNRGEGRGARGE